MEILGLDTNKCNLLFEDENEVLNLVNLEIDKIRKETSNVRKGLFARHSDLVKHFVKMYILMDNIDKRVRVLEKEDD